MCSLESRVPFLDNKLLDFALTLPSEFKVEERTKKILKDIYKNKLPESILTAPKRGFNLPLDKWIKMKWQNEFLEVFNLSETGELGIDKNRLINDFKKYCNENIFDGKKYFYFYVLINWYYQFKKKRL